jgi:hypothetical protein
MMLFCDRKTNAIVVCIGDTCPKRGPSFFLDDLIILHLKYWVRAECSTPEKV